MNPSSTLNIAFVDDEPLARLRLRQLCEDIQVDCPNHIVKEYSQGSLLLKDLILFEQAYNQQQMGIDTDMIIPDVIVLDIHMPGLNGFELARYIKETLPHIALIFMTAESGYAVEAFELCVIDYILKPVRSSRLLMAFEKVKHFKKQQLLHTQLQTIHINNLNHNQVKPHLNQSNSLKLTVHKVINHTPLVIDLHDVIYFKAEDKTTWVKTSTYTYISLLSLTDIEQWLNAHAQPFIRIHRNAIVAYHYFGKLITLNTEKTEDTGTYGIEVIGFSDNTIEVLHVSRRMLTPVKALLKTVKK